MKISRQSRVAKTRGGDPKWVAESPVVRIACVKIMTQGFLSILNNNNNKKLYDVTFSKSDLLLSNLPVLVEVHSGSGQEPYSAISEYKYFYTLFFFIINKSPLIHFTLNTCLFLSAFFEIMDH